MISNNIIPKPNITPEECKKNLSTFTNSLQYINLRKNNKITNTTLHDICLSKQTLPHQMCTKLHNKQYHGKCVQNLTLLKVNKS